MSAHLHNNTNINRLLDIMARLRDPENGCPWDVEQTFDSIAPYTIEEAYEVADAVERDDMADLRDELGDLLLQVVFHSRMAEEGGHFSFDDVVNAISDKMTRRHPHVFADENYQDSTEQTRGWEDIKAEERNAKARAKNKEEPASVLDDVAPGMPALMRATKLQNRAARVGFDWPETEQVLDKLEEEIGELRAEIRSNAGRERIASEMGDILFVYANIARHLGVDAEESLRGTNAKFISRFRFIEDRLRQINKRPEESTLEEMDELWNAAKKNGL